MATAHTSLCIYLKKEPNPDPQTVRGLIERGANPFELVGVKPSGIRYSTMTMIAELPNSVHLFRFLATVIDMRGKLQPERFSGAPSFLWEVCRSKNRELFTEIIPFLVGGQALFSLPMDPWYWTEYFKRHTVDLISLTDIHHYNHHDVLAHALREDASMEMLRFLAKHVEINPSKRFSNGYGYLEIACIFGSFDAVKWLVEEHGCLAYAHDEHGHPLCAMADFDVRFISDLLHDHDVRSEAEREIMQVSGLTNRIFPLLAAVEGNKVETVLPKATYLLKNGALSDLNRRFYREDLYDEWHGVPNPLKLATQINTTIRFDVCLELLKHGAVPTEDVLHTPSGRRIPELVQNAINEYVCLGYFFLIHGADDTKAKWQRSATLKLPNVLYKTIGAFLLCARSKHYLCLSRCLAMA